jgi:hypothetical protein
MILIAGDYSEVATLKKVFGLYQEILLNTFETWRIFFVLYVDPGNKGFRIVEVKHFSTCNCNFHKRELENPVLKYVVEIETVLAGKSAWSPNTAQLYSQFVTTENITSRPFSYKKYSGIFHVFVDYFMQIINYIKLAINTSPTFPDS